MKFLGFEFKRKPKLAYVGEIAKVKISDGDLVVITIPGTPDADQLKSISTAWEAKFGDAVPLVVLSEGMKIGVLSPEKKIEQYEKEQAEQALSDFAEQLK